MAAPAATPPKAGPPVAAPARLQDTNARSQFVESTTDYPIFTNPQKGKVGVSCPNGNIVDVMPGNFIIGKHFADQAMRSGGKGLRMTNERVPRARLMDPLKILDQLAETGTVVERSTTGAPVFKGKTLDHWKVKYFPKVSDGQLAMDFDKSALLSFFEFARIELPLAPEGNSDPTRESLVHAVRAWAAST